MEWITNFRRGQLEMDNNAWYLIEWNFDSIDTPYIKKETHPLTFLDANEIKSPSKQIQPHEPETYLGVTSQVNGSQEAQYCKILEKRNIVLEICPPYICHATIIFRSFQN